MDKKENTEEYDIVLDENAKFHRVYDWLPYSHHRIKQILRDYYNAYIVCIRAYKEGRYAGYKQRYNLYDYATGKLIRKDIHLDDLRRIFAGEDFPLHEDNVRNPKAAHFLEAVNNIVNESNKNE